MRKKWNLKQKAPMEFISSFMPGQKIIAQLLYNRGIIDGALADSFLNPVFNASHDPFLFRDMEIAVDRIKRAILQREKIIVHGDYDADGVTSAAVITKTLKMLGAKVEVFIPHREDDGYGLNMNNLNKFIVQGAKLLITVDCGITNVQEAEFLMQAGVDVIITDHHEPPEALAPALAILDPKISDCGYPFRELSGAGVAYKLSQALLRSASPTDLLKFEQWGGPLGFEKWILDIVAIGTVADVVPLIDENRIFVKWGLVVLQKTKHIGLQKLISSIASQRVDASTIAFQIAPRLNAAGRMNHASIAFELLMTEDAEAAEKLAQELQRNNQDRQQYVEKAIAEAREQVAGFSDKKIAFVFNESWPVGIIGLLAGKLCDELYRPAVAMTLSRDRIVGSARSIPEFNIIAGLRSANQMFSRLGGHRAACGFTLAEEESFDNLKFTLNNIVEKELSGLELSPALGIDMSVGLSDLDMSTVEAIESFAPFGEANRKPLFLLENLQIAAMDQIGQSANHLRLFVKQNSARLVKMLGFGRAQEWFSVLSENGTMDAVCEVGINEWNGNREVEFKIIDLKVGDAYMRPLPFNKKII